MWHAIQHGTSPKKSMEQLLKMTHQEWMAYLQALPEAQRQKAKKEIARAVANRNLQMMLENLNTRRQA